MESRGFKMGPFKLMDLIGNDINYAVSCSVYEQMGQPERLKPSFIQKEKVEQGALGRKSKRGYYEY
jgi:3-hydroxybutyryl-CoA dehydrogenase